MRVLPYLALVLLLSGCLGLPSTPMRPFATETVAAAQTLIHSPTETPTLTVLPELTEPPVIFEASTSIPFATATIPAPPTETVATSPTAIPDGCDPSRSDFCILTGHFILSRPILKPGVDQVDPTYRYGSTQGGLRVPHHGVDFPNASGTPVMAAADGTVVFAGSDRTTPISPRLNTYGNAVVIRHQYQGHPLYSVYGHLSQIDVTIGQEVRTGEKIGEVGATGAAIGSHLHFEVRFNRNDYGSNRNPELWLIPLSDFGALAVRVSDGMGNPIHAFMNIQYVREDNSLESVAQTETYQTKEKYPVQSDDSFQENIAIDDLAPGVYRLTLIKQGKLYERFVDIESGKLTLVNFIIQ